MELVSCLSRLLPLVAQVWQFVRSKMSVDTGSSSSELEKEIAGILDDLKSVEKTWALIKATLADAEAKAVRGEKRVQLWLTQLHHLAYRSSDLVGLYEYGVVAQEVRNRGQEKQNTYDTTASRKRKFEQIYQVHNSSPLLNSSFREEFISGIRKFREELDEINRSKENYHLDKEDAEKINPRDEDMMEHLPTGSIPDHIFFGREKDMNELIGLLLTDDLEGNNPGNMNTVPVIALVGMGGVGKTTLVQHAFNNASVCTHYSKKGWVCVSDNFHAPRLARATLEALNMGSNYEEFDALQRQLTSALRDNKFLLVLDDVWNEDVQQWDAFYNCLKDGAKGSKIIITTRIKTVARITRPIKSIDVGCLSNEDAWVLFQMFAFDNHSNCELQHPILVEIGKEIATKCNGLPLAIKVLGRHLRYENEDEGAWYNVLQSNLWDPALWEEGKQVLGPLALSYIHLPAHLKPCFVISSFYPKGRAIRKDDLVELWMAHELVEDYNEDKGMRYIDSLLSRLFFFEDGDSRKEYVKMHDFIHDLALFLSKDILWDDYAHDAAHRELSIPHEVHHVFIGDKYNFFYQLCHDHKYNSSLRTLEECFSTTRKSKLALQSPNGVNLDGLRKLCFYELEEETNDNFLIHCLENLRNLRHLKLVSLLWENSNIRMGAICTLYNLRILNITSSAINLPKSIGNLRHLKILNIRVVLNVPETICHLTKLHTLSLPGAQISCIPDRISELVNLKKLIMPSSELRRLPKSMDKLKALRVLDMNSCWLLEKLPKILVNMTNLTNLCVPQFLPRGFQNLTKLHELPLFRIPPKESSEKYAGIAELQYLVGIRHDFSIVGLDNVVNQEDAKQAEMANKAYINNLKLHWGEVETYGDTDSETPRDTEDDEEEFFTDDDGRHGMQQMLVEMKKGLLVMMTLRKARKQTTKKKNHC